MIKSRGEENPLKLRLLFLAFLVLVVSFGVGLAREPQQNASCCGFALRTSSDTFCESDLQLTRFSTQASEPAAITNQLQQFCTGAE